jgi:subfamily B ATP-binding cassette protein MsbA
MRSLRRLRPYLHYLRREKRVVSAAITYGILFGITSGLGVPLLIKFVFPPVFDRTDGGLPLGTVILIASAIPLAFMLRAVTGYLNSYYTQLTGVKVLEAIRRQYFGKLQDLPLSFIHTRRSGDLISRGLADTAQLQITLTHLANDGLKQPAQLLGALAALVSLAFISPGAGIVLLCLCALPAAIFPIRFVGRKIVRRAAQFQAELGSATSIFSENLAAAREVRAFGLEEREKTRFGALTRALLLSQMKIAKYHYALSPAIELISATGIGLTLVLAYRSGLELESFIAIVGALYFAYEPIKKLGALNNELKRATAALDRLEVVLDAPNPITDPAAPRPTDQLHGDLTFEDVTFAYAETETPALTHVSVTISAGTVCALVGPSGAGKSTFANLVPRFYEVAGGRVLIDGHDVREYRLADLRRHIALVSQDPVLFNDTIRANLLLGRPGATPAEVEQAARDASAHEFISTLPSGYETVVGERGVSLSGGQRQRLAMARAILRNAPILILDEATSALDSDSEAAIQGALRKLMAGKTVLIIAHRFSTIRHASHILVFDQGKIVGQGSHDELIATHPLYRTLHDRQQFAIDSS